MFSLLGRIGVHNSHNNLPLLFGGTQLVSWVLKEKKRREEEVCDLPPAASSVPKKGKQ